MTPTPANDLGDRPRMLDGILLGEDRPGIPEWDRQADAIGKRYAEKRAADQRDGLRAAFLRLRPEVRL